MKDIKPILASLGLHESEIKTYLAALQHGPGTVLELTKSTGFSRQATYVAIEALTERGLMSSALHGKKRYYAAEHPDKLLAYARRHEAEMKEKIADLARMVPELELQVGGERPVVKVFEGKEGLRVYIHEMETLQPKDIFELTDLDAVRLVLTPEDTKPLRNLLDQKKTSVKGIYSGEPATKEPPANIERLFLPKDVSGFHSDIIVYQDRAVLISFEGKMHTVIIENQAIANALRILFELAYKQIKLTHK